MPVNNKQQMETKNAFFWSWCVYTVALNVPLLMTNQQQSILLAPPPNPVVGQGPKPITIHVEAQRSDSS